MYNYITTVIRKWEDIFSLNKRFLSPFIFRGQQNSNWTLSTSIERVKANSSLKFITDYKTEEKWMLHEFTRKYHLYSGRNIPLDEKFEWLSIMQHHGTPTRLLDFTSSIFIATYFAIIDSFSDASIWAVNRYILRDQLHENFKLPYKNGVALKDEVNKHITDFANQYIARSYRENDIIPTTVVPIEPMLCTDRLAKQQGLFLMPINAEKSFMENLQSAFTDAEVKPLEIPFEDLIKYSNEKELKNDIKLIKINIPYRIHSDIVAYLTEMNITAEVLFPGLDGLAKSLMQTQLRC